jgi:sugar PTS system EIIA component
MATLPKLSGSLNQEPGSFAHLFDTLVDSNYLSLGVNKTPVLAPVEGRAVPLQDVPDPVFSQGMVGYGAAIDPPRRIVEAVAPISGKILKLLPHAYIVMAPENVGILVHLGLDTVRLNGQGFVAHVNEGDTVAAGQVVITFDVPSVEAAGFNPIVPVVIMDETEPANVIPAGAVIAGADIASREILFTANTAHVDHR